MKKAFLLLVVLAAIFAVFWYVKINPAPIEEDTQSTYSTFRDADVGIQLNYPRIWGEVETMSGNDVCPQEDTYRTQDTLNVYGREYTFSNIKLENTESFIKSGVRIYELDTKNLNDCQDSFLRAIARREIAPEVLSSVMLSSVERDGEFVGTYNPRASRLNTEAREQYTFFLKDDRETILIAQAYMSFVPASGTAELSELDGKFNGDMDKYIKDGKTAGQIRNYFNNWRKVSKDFLFE